MKHLKPHGGACNILIITILQRDLRDHGPMIRVDNPFAGCLHKTSMSGRTFKWMALLLYGLCFVPGALRAQEAQSRTQNAQSARDLLRRQMEVQLRELEAPGQPSDETDLGAQILVQRKPKPWSLTLSSDIGEMWTSNVLLADRGKQSDFAITHNDAAVFSYQFTDKFTASLNYRYSVYRYNRVIVQNFDAHNAGISLNYNLPLDINLYSGGQWTSIYSRPIRDTVYEEGDMNIGASKVFPLNFADWLRDRSGVFVGYQTDLRIASPKDFDKVELSPYAGFFYQVNPQLVLQTFYRWQYQKYQNSDRRDFNNSMSTSLAYTPYEWLTLGCFVGYTDNDSIGNANRTYTVFNTGANVRLSWKF